MRDILGTWLNRFGVGGLRKVLVGVVGMTVLLIGVALLVLPGPAFLVIPLGLAILASEFVWARRLLNKAKQLITKKPVAPVPEREHEPLPK